MEPESKESCMEHQGRSFIEFLLGSHGSPGWLDTYRDRNCRRIPDSLLETPLKDRPAAA